MATNIVAHRTLHAHAFPARPWTLNCYRRVAGAFIVDASDPNSIAVSEAIDLFVNRMARRRWSTPRAELDHVANLAAWNHGRVASIERQGQSAVDESASRVSDVAPAAPGGGRAAEMSPRRTRIGMDMVAPYGVYVDGEEVACYETITEAQAHYEALRVGV